MRKLKNAIAVLLSVVLLFGFSGQVFADPILASENQSKNDISNNPIFILNQVYEEAYNNAIANEYQVINSEESAYAYILAHLESVTRTESGKIVFNIDDVCINRGEYNIIMKFVTNINKLIEVNAIVVD